MSEPRPHVLCVGGGWVAVKLVRSMRPALWAGKADMTVVSRDNYLTIHGLVAEALTGKVPLHQIIAPARRVFRPARFHNAEVEAIDLKSRTVTTTRALDGRPYTLKYDHLVLGVGAVDDLSRYPGIAEHALQLKTFWDIFRARSHLVSMLEMAEIEPEPSERRRLLTVVIAGGNYAGVEAACDLAVWYRLMARTDYPRVQAEEARVVIVHSGDRILPELANRYPGLVRFAERRLGQLGVELRLGTRVAAATPDEAVLSSGERIPTRSIVSCTGIAAAPLLDTLPCERDDRGRIETDNCLRVRGEDHLWAAGDCAAVPHPSGGTCPQLAHHAAAGGTRIAWNIRRVLGGKAPRPFPFGGIGEACCLGHRSAIAQLFGVPVAGFPAWLGWRFIVFSMFMPSWGRRVRLLFDWCATPLLGREIVNPRATGRLNIEPAVFEAGQVVVREGDPARRLFLLQEGEAEVVRNEPEESVLETLGSGDRFGVEATLAGDGRYPATLRARTRVRLLALSRTAALALGKGGVEWE